jgi:hypothetical protein
MALSRDVAKVRVTCGEAEDVLVEVVLLDWSSIDDDWGGKYASSGSLEKGEK